MSPVRAAFFSRSSHGSIPSSVAIRCRWVSMANDAEVTPKPRIDDDGGRLVYTT
jgi:hypothetical protein